MRVTDYIAEFIASHPDTSKTVFMVSGGGNMHLIDALGRNGNLNYVCNHHEQACAFAAEGYARLSNKIGVAFVTTGPGATNAITGVYSSWVDSIPILIISGQVKFTTTVKSQPELKLRQLGDQEVNIIDIIKPITKYAVMLENKNEIKYHLQKALYLAKDGRPGPVWLDIPLDIQGADINENELKRFKKPADKKYKCKIDEVVTMLKQAQRPVIIAGNGIALADARREFKKLSNILKIPVIATFARYDILNNSNEYYFGRYGSMGQRAANFIVQNSDLILAIGARLNIRAISYNWEFFGRASKKIVVDIDEAELNKHTLNIDLKINSDAKQFIQKFINKIKLKTTPKYDEWLKKCNDYKQKYPTITNERKIVVNYVDSYNFFDAIGNIAKQDTVFVFGNGTACVSSYQSLKLRCNQRVIVNSGCASMGYDLPAAIGACYGNNKNDIICVTGDGSLQMNLQELQTIIHNKLPIKLFVLNNEGYISIRNTQNSFFKGYKVGSDKESGVSFPDIIKLAKVYGFKTFKISNQINLKKKLTNILNSKGAFVCEIKLCPNEKMEPKLSSEVKPDGSIISKPLEDMYPFLGREEFRRNMIIEPIKE